MTDLQKLTCYTVIVCVIKFLFEGVTFDVLGHAVNLGHADAMTYGALLTPILGAHAFINTRPDQPTSGGTTDVK